MWLHRLTFQLWENIIRVNTQCTQREMSERYWWRERESKRMYRVIRSTHTHESTHTRAEWKIVLLQVQWVTLDTWSSRGPSGHCLSVHFRWVLFRAAWARHHSPRWFTGLLGALLHLIQFHSRPIVICLDMAHGSCMCAYVLHQVLSVMAPHFPPALSFLSQAHPCVCMSLPPHTHIHSTHTQTNT